MKQFILRAVLFVLIGLFAFHLKSYLLLRNNKYQHKVSAKEVYFAIDKSKQKSPAKKVIIGDSTARQFYNSEEKNDTINSLASNQAISLAGQYILLHNYIAAGNKVDTVYAFFTPSSFQNNLDQLYTYNYFIKPFYTSEYKPLLTSDVKEKLNEIPYANIASYFCIRTNNWAPEIEAPKKHDYTLLSPISVDYLHKISDLTKENHIKLILVPAIANRNQKKNIDSFDKNEIVKNHLEMEFEGYFENITYVDSKYFVDDMHLINPEKFKSHYNNIVK